MKSFVIAGLVLLTCSVARGNHHIDVMKRFGACYNQNQQYYDPACIDSLHVELIAEVKGNDTFPDQKFRYLNELRGWSRAHPGNADADFIEERYWAYKGVFLIHQRCVEEGEGCANQDTAMREYLLRLGPVYKKDADKMKYLADHEKKSSDGDGIDWMSLITQSVEAYTAAKVEQNNEIKARQEQQVQQQEQQTQQQAAALESAQQRRQQQALYQQEMQTLKAQQAVAEQQRAAAASAGQSNSSSRLQPQASSGGNSQNTGQALQVKVQGVPYVSEPYNTNETCEGGTVDLASTTMWRQRVRYQIWSSKEADVNIRISMSDGGNHNGPTHLRAGTQEISFEWPLSCSVYSPSSRVDVTSIQPDLN